MQVMTYSATAHRLLLSAPSDVPGRDIAIATETVGRWNAMYGTSFGAVVVPTYWELHAVAVYGTRPQEALNSQLVDDADIVIAMFWHRLGSPTGQAESGTLEEIERAHSLGAYVGILRCTRSVPPGDVDTRQLDKLNEFYEGVRRHALILAYSDEAGLARHVDAILNAAVSATRASRETEIKTAARTDAPDKPADVWPRIEKTHGASSYKLVLTNTGSEPARRVRHRLEAENEGDGLPDEFGDPAELEVLAPGGDARFTLLITMGTAEQFRCVVNWADSAGEHENVATLRYL